MFVLELLYATNQEEDERNGKNVNARVAVFQVKSSGDDQLEHAGGEEDVQRAYGGADRGVPGHDKLYARVSEQVVQPGLQEHPAQVQQHEGAGVLILEALGCGLQLGAASGGEPLSS